MPWKDFVKVVTQAIIIHEIIKDQIDIVLFYGNHSGFVIPILKQYNRTIPIVFYDFRRFFSTSQKISTALTHHVECF